MGNNTTQHEDRIAGIQEQLKNEKAPTEAEASSSDTPVEQQVNDTTLSEDERFAKTVRDETFMSTDEWRQAECKLASIGYELEFWPDQKRIAIHCPILGKRFVAPAYRAQGAIAGFVAGYAFLTNRVGGFIEVEAI